MHCIAKPSWSPSTEPNGPCRPKPDIKTTFLVNCKPEPICNFLLAYFGRLPLCSLVRQPTDESTYVNRHSNSKISPILNVPVAKWSTDHIFARRSWVRGPSEATFFFVTADRQTILLDSLMLLDEACFNLICSETRRILLCSDARKSKSLRGSMQMAGSKQYFHLYCTSKWRLFMK